MLNCVKNVTALNILMVLIKLASFLCIQHNNICKKTNFLFDFVVKCDLNMFPEIPEGMTLADLHHLKHH